ncbi:hypothetical protein [Clostridium sp.]
MLRIDKQFEDSIIKELKNDNLVIFGVLDYREAQDMLIGLHY